MTKKETNVADVQELIAKLKETNVWKENWDSVNDHLYDVIDHLEIIKMACPKTVSALEKHFHLSESLDDILAELERIRSVFGLARLFKMVDESKNEG